MFKNKYYNFCPFLVLTVLHSAHYVWLSHVASWHENIVHSSELLCVGPVLSSCDVGVMASNLVNAPLNRSQEVFYMCLGETLHLSMHEYEKVQFSITLFTFYLMFLTHSLTNTFPNLFCTPGRINAGWYFQHCLFIYLWLDLELSKGKWSGSAGWGGKLRCLYFPHFSCCLVKFTEKVVNKKEKHLRVLCICIGFSTKAFDVLIHNR